MSPGERFIRTANGSYASEPRSTNDYSFTAGYGNVGLVGLSSTSIRGRRTELICCKVPEHVSKIATVSCGASSSLHQIVSLLDTMRKVAGHWHVLLMMSRQPSTPQMLPLMHRTGMGKCRCQPRSLGRLLQWHPSFSLDVSTNWSHHPSVFRPCKSCVSGLGRQ